MDIDKKQPDEQIKGAGVPALPRNLKPRYCGNSGTQVTGGSSSVLDSFKEKIRKSYAEVLPLTRKGVFFYVVV